MKILGKISICALPPVLQDAIKENLENTGLVASGDNHSTELFISLKKNRPRPGVPFLTLHPSKKVRLGAFLKQIEQIVMEPALYTDDFQAGHHFILTQDKILRGPKGEAALTDREVDILTYLARQTTHTATKEALLQNVWKYQPGVDTHTIETHVYRLRQKISSTGDESLLETDENGYLLRV